jgi:type IV pilus assembly protein PilW
VLAGRQPVVVPKVRMMKLPHMAKGARGVSLIELMVGLTIGLFIVAGTLTMFANQVGSSRQLLQQARLHQEMRSVMDLVTRDLRRAGAWDNAILGTVATGAGSATTVNPYRLIEVYSDNGFPVIEHRFTRDSTTGDPENDTLDTNERFGFKRDGDLLRMRLGGSGWQPLTDPAVVRVTDFRIDADPQPLSLTSACQGGCAGSSCPVLTVRHFTLTLTAELANDKSVSRTLVTTVRPRNDLIEGACP